MKNIPKISIIIPVYNASAYIKRCLDSIKAQTFNDYEIIIVNDGSTDDSLELIQAYAKKNEHMNFNIITQKNQRAAAARNNGISHAKGKFITFIDADDFVASQYLEILYKNAMDFDAEVSMCSFYKSSASEIKQIDFKQNHPYVRTNIEAMYECCDINKTRIVSPCLKLYKKELYDGITYPVGRTYEDLAITHKVIYRANKIVTTDLEMYCYFNTEESVVHGTYTFLNFYSENLAQDERLEFFEKIGIAELDRKNHIAVQRNRITNYCRGYRYLQGHESDCEELKMKFDNTYQKMKKKYELGLFDKVLFWCFKKFPKLYVKVCYSLYCFYNEKIKGK